MNLDALRQHRQSKGISQEALARILDISLKQYNQKELGKTEFKASEIVTICKELDIDAKEILGV